MIAANGNDLAALSNNDLSLREEANACAATCTCILSRVQLAAALCSELRIFDVNFIVGRYAIAAAETAGGRNRCIHQIQLSTSSTYAKGSA